MGKAKIALVGAAVIAATLGLRSCQTKDVPQGKINVPSYDKGEAPGTVYQRVETNKPVEVNYTGSHKVRRGEKLIDIIVREYKLDPCKDGAKIAAKAGEIVKASPNAFAEDSDILAADGVKPCDKSHKAPYGGVLIDNSDGIVGDTMYAGAKLTLPGLTRPGTEKEVNYVKVDDASKLPGGTELYKLTKGEAHVYTVKAGNTVWNLVADLCGIDPCNSNNTAWYSNDIVGANPNVFGNDSDTLGYTGVEPCENGKRPSGAEKVEEADGIKGDNLPVGAEIKIPCKSTQDTYEKAGVVEERDLSAVKKSNWLLWKESGYSWQGFKDTYLKFGSDAPKVEQAPEAPSTDDASDNENPDAGFLSGVEDHVKNNKNIYGGVGLGAAGLAVIYAAYRLARRSSGNQNPNPPASGAGAPRDARNSAGPRGKSEGIKHTYRGGSTTRGASAYLDDEGDSSVLEYISKKAPKNGRDVFDSKLSKSTGMNARIAEAYKTMNAREVKDYFAGMGVKMSETSIRKVAREQLGAEYAQIASARSRANLKHGYNSGAPINDNRMPAYAVA